MNIEKYKQVRQELLQSMEKSFLFNHKIHELEEEFWEVYRYINKKGIYGKIYQKNWKFIDKVVDIDKSKKQTYMGGLNDWIISHPTHTYTQPEHHGQINVAKQY
jgi:hypothetical protein